MKISRRHLLASGAAAAAMPLLAGQAFAEDTPKKKIPKDAIILTAMVKAKAGKEDEVKKVLGALVKETRQEEGCIYYILHQAAKDKTEFMFYEVWADRDAINKHGQTPHMKALDPSLQGLTDKGGGVVFYELVE